jgi:hypothetical protein
MTREDNEPKDLVLAETDKLLTEIEEMAAALRNDMQEVKAALLGVEEAVASLGGAIATVRERIDNRAAQMQKPDTPAA